MNDINRLDTFLSFDSTLNKDIINKNRTRDEKYIYCPIQELIIFEATSGTAFNILPK